MTAYSALANDQKSSLVRAAATLVASIDRAARNPAYQHPDLSETLARAGLLPMFGFPTKVRALYWRRPDALDDDEAAQVSSRSLDMAISSFAPGAEVLKDKEIHTCTGFAAWDYSSGLPRPADPLGAPKLIARCPECGATEIAEKVAPCRVCSHDVDTFQMFEPAGFRTDYRPRDYEEHD